MLIIIFIKPIILSNNTANNFLTYQMLIPNTDTYYAYIIFNSIFYPFVYILHVYFCFIYYMLKNKTLNLVLVKVKVKIGVIINVFGHMQTETLFFTSLKFNFFPLELLSPLQMKLIIYYVSLKSDD